MAAQAPESGPKLPVGSSDISYFRLMLQLLFYNVRYRGKLIVNVMGTLTNESSAASGSFT